MNVYLAGPISHLTYEEATKWRLVAEGALRGWGLTAYSPMRGKALLRHEGVLRDAYDISPMTTQKGLTTRDRHDVAKADALLVNFLGATQVSCGTPIEFGWADALNIPIVMVMEKEGNPFDHPMIREIAGYRAESLVEGLHIVHDLLVP